MATPQGITFVVKVLVLADIALIGVIDLALLVRYGPEGTISYALHGWSKDFPILPYLISFGMGAFVYHIATGR